MARCCAWLRKLELFEHYFIVWNDYRDLSSEAPFVLVFDHETKNVTDANPGVIAEISARLAEVLGW